MVPRKLPILDRSLRWLVVPCALLIVYASWEYFRDGAYWEAGFQLLMLLLLPVVFSRLNRLPQRATFTAEYLLIERAAGMESVPLHNVLAIDSVFLQLNQRSVFRLRYLDAHQQPQTLVVLGGPALSRLENYRKTL